MPGRTAPLLRVVALLGAGALLGAACTAGYSDRPPVAVRGAEVPAPPTSSGGTDPPAAPPLGEYDPTSLPWRDCTADTAAQLGGAGPAAVECASVAVDADPAAPGLGGTLELDLTRVGTGTAPLVVLGEAGGEPGTVRAARLAAVLPAELLDAVTLVGFARRGTGPSDAVDCVPGQTRADLFGAEPDAPDPGGFLSTARTAVQTCVQESARALDLIASRPTARDLEQLRVALDAPVLHLLALGEASTAVAAFARAHPASVGRVVLDGAVDPALDAVAAAEATALAAEDGFAAFAADCVARSCPVAPDPRGALAALEERLRAAPLATPSVTVTAGLARQAVLELLGAPERWPELAAALAAAAGGDGTGIAAVVAPVLAPSRGLPARFDPGLATACNDTPGRVPPERAAQLAEQWRARAPLFGPVLAQRLLLCSAWPVPTDSSPDADVEGVAPVLVVATPADPVTPGAAAERVASRFEAATVVRWEGTAHGAVERSACVAQAVSRYVLADDPPADGTLCPP